MVQMYIVVDDNGDRHQDFPKAYITEDVAQLHLDEYEEADLCPNCNHGKLVSKMSGGTECNHCGYGEPCF